MEVDRDKAPEIPGGPYVTDDSPPEPVAPRFLMANAHRPRGRVFPLHQQSTPPGRSAQLDGALQPCALLKSKVLTVTCFSRRQARTGHMLLIVALGSRRSGRSVAIMSIAASSVLFVSSTGARRGPIGSFSTTRPPKSREFARLPSHSYWSDAAARG